MHLEWVIRAVVSDVDLPCDIIPALVRQPDHHPPPMVAELSGGWAAKNQAVELLIGGQAGEGGQEAVCREGYADKEDYTASPCWSIKVIQLDCKRSS